MSSKDSAPGKWQHKAQTEMKHAVLSNYLTRWSAILGQPREGRPQYLYYVDGFAGRGRFPTGEPGSPVIAMKVGQQLHENFGGNFYLQCFNVEHNEENFASLEKEVEIAKNRYPSVEVHNYFGRFEDNIDAIMTRIPDNRATLIFIDPFGYHGIEIPLKLLRRRYNEIIVTFMSWFLNWFLTDPEKALVMDQVFETRAWRDLVHRPHRQELLVDLYGREIQAQASERLGLREVFVYPIDVPFEGKDADIYHLMHLSRHEKARQVMEEAVRKARDLRQPQLSLEMSDGLVEEMLMSELERSGETEALSLAKTVWLRTYRVTWHEDIRQAVKALEERGEVSVNPYDGRRRKLGSLVKEKDLVVPRGGQIRLA